MPAPRKHLPGTAPDDPICRWRSWGSESELDQTYDQSQGTTDSDTGQVSQMAP